MFKKHTADLSARALPLRNVQLSANTSSSLVFPNYIWFTPEAVILDAISVVVDILWLWKTFQRLLPVFVLRLAAFMFLAFVLIAPKVGSSVAAQYVERVPPPSKLVEEEIEIKVKIVANYAPVKTWPVPKNYISTYFSFSHQGIDIPAPYGYPIQAFEKGKVFFAGWSNNGFGKLVIIRHDNGLITKYAHLSTINVEKGEEIAAKTTVGRVGATGFATGAHLHFEIRTNAGPINPLSVLP